MNYTADEIDGFFKSGALELLGMGSRRACYRLPGNDALCLKCYRSDEEIKMGRDPGRPDSRPLASGAVREIRACRFNERKNTCCQEYRYWRKLSAEAPRELISVFPETMKIFRTESRGWCLVEELMTNDDGSAIVKFLPAFNAADEAERRVLAELFDSLENLLISCNVSFFDPQTVMVQRRNNTLRLRIPDFEPATRTLLPLEKFFPPIVRAKVKRRFARYRKTWEKSI